MARTLSGAFTIVSTATHRDDQSLSNPLDRPTLDGTLTYTDGTDDTEGNLLYHARVTVDNEVLQIDVSGGSVPDKFGNAQVFVSLVGIHVRNRSAVSGESVLVGGGANAVGGIAADTVHPSGSKVLTAGIDGYPIVAGTGDKLTLDTTGSGATLDCDVLLVGADTA